MPAAFSRFSQVLTALAILVGFSVPVGSHPHTIVEARATLGFTDAKKVNRVILALTLDEMTTSILVEGLDENGNGKFEAEELRDLARENAESLSEFNYFTELRAAGALVSMQGLTGYDYRYIDGLLILMLELTLETPVDPVSQALTLRLYDPTFYVMVNVPEKDAIGFGDGAPSVCGSQIARSNDVSNTPLTEALFDLQDPSVGSIGRELADVVTIACPLTQ